MRAFEANAVRYPFGRMAAGGGSGDEAITASFKHVRRIGSCATGCGETMEQLGKAPAPTFRLGYHSNHSAAPVYGLREPPGPAAPPLRSPRPT